MAPKRFPNLCRGRGRFAFFTSLDLDINIIGVVVEVLLKPRFSVWSVSSYVCGRRIDRFAEPFDNGVD
jgi:hypothetical protein